ncbi:hypothetical protein [Myxococcus sp. Y35]|uniref:hypothetical protein n=1 Tax=Pseudomyxococcus flavus TaxID=3115648 RepID=UPI003CF6A995
MVLPTAVPITFADSTGALGGDGKGPLLVGLDSPGKGLPGGEPKIDRLSTSNLAPLVVLDVDGQRRLHPSVAAGGGQDITDSHCKPSHLSQADINTLSA